ncbi:MAG: substrate-binding domain-containing protein, partial [Bacteroidota bacterium]
MDQTLSLRIGGVPEHFNFPWHLANEKQLLTAQGIELTWQDFPGGTGAMCRALRQGELDLAVVLTEGAVADMIAGNEARILGTYVQSPLIWGVHVGGNSAIDHPSTLEGSRFAISRYGSGSHLMALLHAQERGWDPQQLQFVVVKNFDGARKALAEGSADAFLWEKYTTKPTVDRGEFRRLGEIRTEWPCFVMLGRPELFESDPARLHDLLFEIRKARYLKTEAQLIPFLAERYQQQEADLQEWYHQTEWLIRPEMEVASLDRIQKLLLAAQIIEEGTPSAALVAPYCKASPQRLSSVMYDWRVASTYQMLALQGKAEGPLQVSDLTALGHLDQYHYLGEQTSRELIGLLGIQTSDRVADLGSGVGGT